MDRRGPGQAAESYPCRTAPGTGAGPAEVGGLEGPPGRARAAQARPGPMDSDARGPARRLGSTPPSRAWTGAGGVPDVPPVFPLRESRDPRPLSGRGARRTVQRCRPDTRPLSVRFWRGFWRGFQPATIEEPSRRPGGLPPPDEPGARPLAIPAGPRSGRRLASATRSRYLGPAPNEGRAGCGQSGRLPDGDGAVKARCTERRDRPVCDGDRRPDGRSSDPPIRT